jgi:hypothetical protein
MNELPEGMLAKGRKPVQDFTDDEKLYRAFPPDCLDGTALEIDALELPDMSVNRGKFGPPEWMLLLDVFNGFGVAAFCVGDIPKELLHRGVERFTSRPFHSPTPQNYPHSEIRMFNGYGHHINAKDCLDPDLDLRWRERLLQRIRVIIRPDESRALGAS